MEDERDDLRDDFYDEDYDGDDGCRLDGIFAALLLIVMAVLVVAVVGLISYDIGRHQMLTSEEAREIGRELVYDSRVKNGDVIEKSYMPEGGFSFESDTMMLSEFYKETSLDGTFYIYSNDGKFLRHFREDYPEALYPSNEWTSEEVLQFYHDSLESWAYHDSAYLGKGYYICCTPDYKHCFAVKDDDYNYGAGATTGWLIIDGVYVTAIDEQVADSLEPDVLIEQYRNGIWDGSLLRSKDYGVTVSLSYDRTELRYSYQKKVYTSAQDPQGLAYDGYENPWWYDDELAEKYGVGKYYEAVCDFGYESTIRVKRYPDLPDDFEMEQIVETESPYEPDCVLDVLLKDGRLQRYSREELLDEWDLSEMTQKSLDDDVVCYVKEPFGLSDVIYYLDAGKLYALKTGGEISVMLEHVDVVDYSYSLRGSTLFVLEKGGLYGYDMYEGVVYMMDRDVLELDFNEIMAYRKADGYHALYRVRSDKGPDYATLYLGEESLDYYLEFRKNLWNADWRNR